MLGFHSSHERCDAGRFMIVGSLMTIILVLVTVGLLDYWR